MEFIQFALNKFPDDIIEIYFGNFIKDVGGSYDIGEEKFNLIKKVINKRYNINSKQKNQIIHKYKNMMMYANSCSVCKVKQHIYFQTDRYVAICVKYKKIHEKAFPILGKYDDTLNITVTEYDINNYITINFIKEFTDDKTLYYIKLKISEPSEDINNIIRLLSNYL